MKNKVFPSYGISWPLMAKIKSYEKEVKYMNFCNLKKPEVEDK